MDTQCFDRPARLHGTVRVPGDKSISHRALLLPALAQGSTRIVGLSGGGDVTATRNCLTQLGVSIDQAGGDVIVHGRGLQALRTPQQALGCVNSGTSFRFLLGVLAGAVGVSATLTGDPSLSRRPMRRVADPLRQLGAQITLSDQGTAPAHIVGQPLHGGYIDLAVASAQVKSALLLAGLHASGPVSVREPEPSRDHTERLLRAMGADLQSDQGVWTIQPGLLRAPAAIAVPGDPSSAAFAIVAALLHPQGAVTMTDVCCNPTRIGWIAALQRMGARISVAQLRESGGEPIGDVIAQTSSLQAVQIAAAEVPSLIDEIPILALAAAAASGTSRFAGVAELRVKESDRLAETCRLLGLLGVTTRSGPDWFEVDGLGSAQRIASRPANFDAGLDHRMAMTAAVAGLVGCSPVTVHGMDAVATSWPQFTATMQELSKS